MRMIDALLNVTVVAAMTVADVTLSLVDGLIYLLSLCCEKIGLQ